LRFRGRKSTGRPGAVKPLYATAFPEVSGSVEAVEWACSQREIRTAVDSRTGRRYCFGMKSNTKSSITLPAEELKLVVALQARLKARSKVEIVRRGLRLLQEATDRESLRRAYRRASLDTRESLALELPELDLLVSEGLDKP
jgi:hypothetical protein